MPQKIRDFYAARKKTVWIIGLICIVGAYWGYKKITTVPPETQYLLGKVERGSINAVVSGTGQVSASNQVDLKSKAGGDVVSVYAQSGQNVRQGEIIAQFDARDAVRSVRDAQLNLESAQIAQKKLMKDADTYSILQAQNALASAKSTLEKLKTTQATNLKNAQDTKDKATDNLNKAYEDAFSDVADAFLDLPTLDTKLYDILYSSEIGTKEATVNGFQNVSALVNSINDRDVIQKYVTSAEDDFKKADTQYDKVLETYKSTTRTSKREDIEKLLNDTLDMTTDMSQAAKSSSNLLDTWVDLRKKQSWSVFAQVTTYQGNLGTYTGQLNTHVSTLVSIQKTLQDNHRTLDSATRDIENMGKTNPLDLAAAEASVKEKDASLQKLEDGTDQLDLQAQELTIAQRENTLADAREKLADYTVRAPFAGTVAKMDAKPGKSFGANAAVGTLITKQQLAEISLNEVDIAQIKLGQKAILTFDAIPEITVSGAVAEMDTIGTSSQGVVSYTVKITLDTQNEDIKPGMTVSANIITKTSSDVLMVPNSAVKTSGNQSYVEAPSAQDIAIQSQAGTSGAMNGAANNTKAPVSLKGATERVQVEIGIANDESTEIKSGLNEGETIITNTIAPKTGSGATSTQSSSFRIPGMGGGGGGGGGNNAARAPR